jgi:hypothetical protein
MTRLGIAADVLNNSLASGMGRMVQTSNASATTGTKAAPAPPVGSEPQSAGNDAARRFDRFEKTGKAAQTGKSGSTQEGECKTCAERKYQDGSDDGGVSFQSPTKVSPAAAGAAVRSHEQEHVTRNAAKAEREGKVAHSHVAIHTAVCPECGKPYVSGGTTTTTYTDDPKKDDNGNKIQGIKKGGDNRSGAASFKPVGNPELLKKFAAGTDAYAA